MDNVIVRTRSQLNDLYDESALTIEGLDPSEESLGQFKEVLQGVRAWKEDSYFCITSGEVMNKAYKLHGDNAYPNENCTLVSAMNIDYEKVITLRRQFGGRWFDDIVDNNAWREGKKGIYGVFTSNLDEVIA